ncbi:hypothetical protein Syn7502_03054 [Synechococcus sp. PCC 7502]|uniref:hypothetical protein n=1 Tax=Synechococcus sp. PCC 7502 TaxID=1173263 RepID=UPI00029FA15F|nr:hypothetical protein [Synechococcus sp. PCC 7502]AFY74954.1 hypothetical protein Syn7502_03054 [Synechococcus sp. PCC 7502]
MNPKSSLETVAEKIEPSLKALQLHYKDIVEKYQPIVDHAHLQLKSIDGILSGLASTPVKSLDSPQTIIQPISKVTNATPAKPTGKVRKSSNTSKSVNADNPKSLTFVSKYKSDTLTSAVGKILSDRQGKAVGIEEVVAVLYGKIDAEQFKVAKDRVTKNLSKGKVAGLWERVPSRSGYYTAKS